jgi:hypothetical protein
MLLVMAVVAYKSNSWSDEEGVMCDRGCFFFSRATESQIKSRINAYVILIGRGRRLSCRQMMSSSRVSSPSERV